MICHPDVDGIGALAQRAVGVEIMLGQHSLQLLGQIMPGREKFQIIAFFRVGHRAAAEECRGDKSLHTALAFKILRPDAQRGLLAGMAEQRQHLCHLSRLLDAELIYRAGRALLAQHSALHTAAAVELLRKGGHALVFGLQDYTAVIKVFAKTGHRIGGGHVTAGLCNFTAQYFVFHFLRKAQVGVLLIIDFVLHRGAAHWGRSPAFHKTQRSCVQR